MKPGFFIDRPVFSTVLSILIVIVGIIGLALLPVDQYPQITPPVVKVSALAAGTGEHDDSSIAVVSKAGLGAGQLAPGSFVHSVLGVGFQGIGDGSRGDAAVVLHHIVRRIQIPQGAVDLDALIFQSLLEVVWH